MQPAFSPGFQQLTVQDTFNGETFPALVFYPSHGPANTFQAGPYSMEVALNAPVAEGRHRLVVLSHGSGSSPWVYRGLALALAQQGCVVVLPEHPGNNRNDNSRLNTLDNLRDRPRHIQCLLDILYREPWRNAVAGKAILLGHSMGAYTMLALAGGRVSALPQESPEEVPVDTVTDDRIAGLYLMAPATPWFRKPGALAALDVPVRVVTGEADTITTAIHYQILERGMPATVGMTHVSIPNANHYAFLTPFPAALSNPGFPPSQDAPGFDREAFQVWLANDGLGFVKMCV